MATWQQIKTAYEEYRQERGFWRRWLPFFSNARVMSFVKKTLENKNLTQDINDDEMWHLVNGIVQNIADRYKKPIKSFKKASKIINILFQNGKDGEDGSLLTLLKQMQKSGILNPTNLNVVKNHSSPAAAIEALSFLKWNKLLSPENISIITENKLYSPMETAEALLILSNGNLLSPKNRALLICYKPKAIADALRLLKYHTEEDLLSEAIRDTIANHSNSVEVAEAIQLLSSADMLNDGNVAAIMHDDPRAIAAALITLRERNLDNDNENRQVIANSCDPEAAATALVKLSDCDILDDRNREMIAEANEPDATAEMLICISMVRTKDSGAFLDLLTEKNRHRFKNHKSLRAITAAAKSLERVRGMLNQSTFEAIIDSPNPAELADAIHLITPALDQDDFDTLKDHQDPVFVAQALMVLKNLRTVDPSAPSLLTSENRSAIKEHPNPWDLTKALQFLKHAHGDLLKQETFDAVKGHQNPTAAAHALLLLNHGHLLSPEKGNIAVVRNHPDPKALAAGLKFLRDFPSLWTEANVDAIKNHHDPKEMAEALLTLNRSDLLERYRDSVKTHKKPIELASALEMLKRSGPPNMLATNANGVIAADDPIGLARAVIVRQDAKGLISTITSNELGRNHLFAHLRQHTSHEDDGVPLASRSRASSSGEPTSSSPPSEAALPATPPDEEEIPPPPTEFSATGHPILVLRP